MKLTIIPPIVYKILGLKNVAGSQINPATEENQVSILEEMKQAFYMKLLMATIKRLSFNSAGELRTVVGSIGTVTTVTTMTTGNIGIGDSGKTATMLSTSSNNFQSGARRLIRKV